MTRIFSRLKWDKTGTALVEFALVAPLLVTMLVGVVQVGVWVQSYNAMRNVVNDTTRFAMTEYQRGNKIDNEAIQDRASFLASGGKYNLGTGTFVPVVTTKATQVSGVKQLRLVATYDPPHFLPMPSVTAPQMTYGRDIYLYDQAAVAGT